MAKVERKKGESFESLHRRFSKRVKGSGVILQARKIRFRNPSESKNASKRSALRGIEITEKRDYLMKVGRLIEKKRRRGRR